MLASLTSRLASLAAVRLQGSTGGDPLYLTFLRSCIVAGGVYFD